MRLWILALVLLASVFGANAGVYKWTDDKGTVHFSAQPPADRKTEEMASVDTRVSPALLAFCSRLKLLIPTMLSGADLGATRAERLKRVGLDEASLRETGFTHVSLDRLDDAIVAYRGGALDYKEQARAVEDIHGRCIAGAYGDVQSIDISARSAGSGKDGTGDLNSSGTGFLVSPELIATSLHVVEGNHSILVHFSDGKEATATVLSMDRSKDLAVLKLFRKTGLRFLQVAGDTVGLGAEVFTIGFPQPDLMGFEPKLSTGIISSTSGIQDDVRTYQISVPVQAGNSGGPLIDSAGRVVGIVASKLNAAKVFEWTGDLPQNVNYAVKSTYLTYLISSDVLGRAVPVVGEGVQGKAAAVREAVVRIEVH